MTDEPELATGATPTEEIGSSMPYTVFFPVGGEYHPADLEHAAPLPRVGDTVEYIDERGRCSRYTVREVIHTLQLAADQRPVVGSDDHRPGVFAAGDDGAELPGDGSLRAGLPKVILEASSSAGRTEERGGFALRVASPPPSGRGRTKKA
ncbi:MAG: hypothetical protein M3R49_01060 [Chloroflexota bacterium]|nr:hypothetical protein [Chloroflexota bacterium]